MSSTRPSRWREFKRAASEPFEVWIPVGLRAPAELHVTVRRFPRRRLAAYWNGCSLRW